MDLPKKNKLMLLLLSRENPLLGRIRALERGLARVAIDEDDVIELIGTSRETPKNWRKGKEMRPSKVESVFDSVLAALEAAAKQARTRGRFDIEEYQDIRERLLRFKAAVLAEKDQIYDAARTLGMTTMSCQQTLDRIIYDAYPLLPAAHYPPPPKHHREVDRAQEDRDRFEGLYLAFVRRHGSWLQCPLRVRYLLESGEGRFLRCKMNSPIVRPGETGAPDADNLTPTYWEYDGVLSVRPQRLFWTFEKRSMRRNDYYYFITNAVNHVDARSFVLTGLYLTADQDREQTEVSGDVLLRRMFVATDDPYHLSYRDVMSREARVLTDPKEIAQVDRDWETYRRPGLPNYEI